jgi:catechol 2,3-dioxygenase-like lactoylglutathione lyase family enzyme
MSQSIGQVAIVVRDYNEALEFYVGVLGFKLIEDTPIPTQSKRRVTSGFYSIAPVERRSPRRLHDHGRKLRSYRINVGSLTLWPIGVDQGIGPLHGAC